MKKLKKFKYHQEDDFRKDKFSSNKKMKSKTKKKQRYYEVLEDEENTFDLINNILK